jgi:O-antigen/teichoic acid export membrane protein
LDGQETPAEKAVRRRPSLIRNAAIVAGAQAITWAATFGFTVAQARYLGPARFGELSLALSYAVILGVVVDFGLSNKLARDVARRPASAGPALLASVAVRTALWSVAMPFVWASTVLLGYGSELQASILILAVSVLVGGLPLSLAAYFQGCEAFVFPSLASIAQRGSAAVLGVAALALGYGIVVVASVYLAACMLQILVMIPGLRRHPVSLPGVERGAAVDMFRGTATLGCFWILAALYSNVDMVILQRLAPPENVAWYAAAYRLFNATTMVVGFVLGTVLYPALARLSVDSRDALRAAMERSFAFTLASGVFLALTLVVAADQIVALVYSGHDYAPAASALRLLGPGIAAMYANGVFFLALLALGFEKRLLVMAALLALLNPLANLLVIPVLQQNGAALITSVTEAIVLVCVLAATPNDLRRAARPAVVAKVLVAATPAVAALWLLRGWSPFISVPIAGTVYAVLVLGLGIVPLEVVRALADRFRAPRPSTRSSDTSAEPIRVESPAVSQSSGV